MMGKREALKNILEGKPADRIPVIMNCCSLPPAQYGYDMGECLFNPEKMTECVVGSRKRMGYDGLFAGVYSCAGAIAGHLPNDERPISMDGEGTIKCVEDLAKLNPFNPAMDPMLQSRIATINMMREAEPDEPIYVITMHPTSVAFALIGAKPAFKSMVKNPDFFNAVALAVEDACITAYKELAKTDLDFLWLPTPNFGGFCISRKTYEKCIYESNVRFMKRMREEVDCKVILHTCGLYDDRLDLVLDEHGDAWHLADTSTKKIKDLYGDKISLMGTIPSVAGMMEMSPEELYKFSYQECMDAAYDGRFILSADCDVPPSTTDENMMAVVKAAKDAEKVLFGK